VKVRICDDRPAAVHAAAAAVADLLREAIVTARRARMLVGAVSEEMLAALSQQPDVRWAEVELFHSDEWVGLAAEHPASRRRELFDALITPTRMGRYHLLDAEHDIERTCRHVGAALAANPIDVALVEIGIHAELGWNVAPSDFLTERPFLVVRVDEANRGRQLEKGNFPTLGDVPEWAVTVSLRQLMKARAVVCLAAGVQSAEAVRRCVNGIVSPLAPASILQTHPRATLFVDVTSAALLPSGR